MADSGVVVPGLVIEFAFEVDGSTLLHAALLEALGALARDADVVPGGLFLHLAVRVAVLLARRDGELNHLASIVERTHDRVLADVSDDDYLVYACHDSMP